jgi:hypothetical protein
MSVSVQTTVVEWFRLRFKCGSAFSLPAKNATGAVASDQDFQDETVVVPESFRIRRSSSIDLPHARFKLLGS